MRCIGVCLFMRCPCVRRVWPILNLFIIIPVFLVVFICGQGFMFCFISLNVFIWFTQWFCHMFRDSILIWFFMSIIVLHFCLGASGSDTVAFFACWSASSFPFILQWPGVHINLIFLFRFFSFSTWFMMLVEMSFVWKVLWMLLMVLKESVKILKCWWGSFSISFSADIMAMALAVYIEQFFGSLCVVNWVFIIFEKSNLYFVIICLMRSGISFSLLFLVSHAPKFCAIWVLRIQRGVH